MIPIKLILLGDGRVGKTSLAQRFLHDVFYDESPGTVSLMIYYIVNLQ